MYVCMYVPMYVCMHVCMYVCTYVCMYLCMYLCTYACMYVPMYIYIYIRLTNSLLSLCVGPAGHEQEEPLPLPQGHQVLPIHRAGLGGSGSAGM